MVSAYLVVKWFHVIAAAYLVGSIFTGMALRAHADRAKDPSHRAVVWNFIVKGEEMLAIPFAGLLLVTGLLMVFGPTAGGWSLANDLWVTTGLGLFFVILIVMAGLSGNAAKKVLAIYSKGGDHSAAKPHEKSHMMLTSVGAVLAVGVVWLMVTKPF